MSKRKPDFKFDFGDVVSVGGYEGRAFQIDGYRHEECHYPGVVTTELIYELTDVQTLDWLEADEEDLTLPAPCDQADEYTAQLPKLTPNSRGDDFMSMFFGIPSEEPKGPRKPTARELSSQEAAKRKQERKDRAEEIDNLLDIANWNRGMLAKTGDESYGDALFGVEAKLFELTVEEESK